jgi:hypothetical protein
VLSRESVANKVLREIRKDLPRFSGRQIALSVSPQVAEVLLGPARKALAALAEELGREIEIRARPGQHQEQFEVTALDAGPPVSLSLRWLGGPEPESRADETGLDEAAELAEVAAETVAELAATDGDGAPAPAALDGRRESPILPGPDTPEEP